MKFLNNDNDIYTKRKFDNIKSVDLEKESLLIEVKEVKSKKILGYLLFSIEISDWRNGINIYFYEQSLDI